VAEGASAEPVWDVVARYLKHHKVIRPPRLNQPRLVGVESDPGIGREIRVRFGIRTCSAIPNTAPDIDEPRRGRRRGPIATAPGMSVPHRTQCVQHRVDLVQHFARPDSPAGAGA
jgi:hypothetical protein